LQSPAPCGIRGPRGPCASWVSAVVAYALSPIDLIPDFIPVLGLLDDIVLVPLGLMLVVRLIPPPVLAEHRERAGTDGRLPVSRTAGLVILVCGRRFSWDRCVCLASPSRLSRWRSGRCLPKKPQRPSDLGALP
jgi:uncharacterized membrane protein YkvA (DUF1232 family)